MPDLSATDVLSQAYQGMANTVGPYFNISSIFQPAYGQTALGNQQQQMFGYNVGPGGTIGTPYTALWRMGRRPAAYAGIALWRTGSRLWTGRTGWPAWRDSDWHDTWAARAQRRLVARQFQAHLAALKFIRRHKIRGSVLVRRLITHMPVNSGQRRSWLSSWHTQPEHNRSRTLTVQRLLRDLLKPILISLMRSTFRPWRKPMRPIRSNNSPDPQTLNQQSQNQLAAGGHLTPEQERANSQAALSAFSNAGAGTNGNQRHCSAVIRSSEHDRPASCGGATTRAERPRT